MTKRITIAAVALLVLLMPTAANALDVLDKDSGYGRAAVYAWSRGYHDVGVVARYTGHGIVRFTIRCGNGYSDRIVWDDSGPRFRYHRTVPAFTRCNYSAVLTTNGSFAAILIGAW